MKVIDLLNKIANGEEVPKKIKYEGKIWKLVNKTYFSNRTELLGDYIANAILLSLNDEIEIIEEDKKIEKLGDLDFIRLYIKR